MDTKLTLSFDQGVAERAKAFAEANNISLSRLVEFMLSKVIDKRYRSLDEFFQLAKASESDWQHTVSWIDCLTSSGRGIFMRANPSNAQSGPVAPPLRAG